VTRLRVALDARRLQDRPLGGVGRSLAGVIDLLAAELELVLLTDARRPPVESDLEQRPLRSPRRAPEAVWIQHDVPRWLRSFDGVFHGTFNQLPYRLSVPAVATIHDLSFEVHPEGFTRAKRRVFQMQARHAARVARRIMVPSNATKDEVVVHYGVRPDRVFVTPWGVEPRFDPSRANEAGALCARLGVRGRYITAMGGARRRGLEVAVAAWRNVRADTGVALVVVGSETLPDEPGLAYAGSVSDDEWAALLAGAEAFCYPTRYEGFGIPALESMASGTPVVCARVGSLPEVVGDAAEWCRAPTPDEITSGLRHVLNDPRHTEDLRRRGLRRVAAHPSWEHTAGVLLRAYHEAYDC
jgi:glycosyltransferase involved in cell wall biosynthesis